MDDLLGTVGVDPYLRAEPLRDVESEHFKQMLKTSKGPEYGTKHETRRRELETYATAINSRSLVPMLKRDRLINVSDRPDAGEA